VRAATAPALARRHVQDEVTAPFTDSRLQDLALLTSEVVTNAVQHSRTAAIELAVVDGTTFTRIEVSNPGHPWDRRPEPRASEPDEAGGWGLFLVEQLSDRWGVSDSDRTVWFEFDHPGGSVS
jgi:anti-sigma regulatory factor (Ser/Thr protein kinase)